VPALQELARRLPETALAKKPAVLLKMKISSFGHLREHGVRFMEVLLILALVGILVALLDVLALLRDLRRVNASLNDLIKTTWQVPANKLPLGKTFPEHPSFHDPLGQRLSGDQDRVQ